MLTNEIKTFFMEMGLPIELLIRKAPKGISKESIYMAAEEIYHCGMTEPIRMPREIWKKAAEYQEPENDVAFRKMAEALPNEPDPPKEENNPTPGVEFWRNKHTEMNRHKNRIIVALLISNIIVFAITFMELFGVFEIWQR